MFVWLSNFATLIIGSFLLTVIMELIAGDKRFSLQLGNIFFITLVGSILSVWFSWKSTGILLGLYAIYIVAAGINEKKLFPHDSGD